MFTGVATTEKGLAHFESITSFPGALTRERVEEVRSGVQKEMAATSKPSFTCIIELGK